MAKIRYGDKVTQSFVVEKEQELLPFLLEKQIRKSKNAIQSVLKRKLITVNGELVTQFNHLLKRGDKVAVMKMDQSKKIQRLKGMTIVYEDKEILIINKESGLLSTPTPKEPLVNAQKILASYIKAHSKTEQIFMVQRLEREIAGLMIFVKSLEAQARFKKNWNYQVPVLRYSGIIQGKLNPASGEIKSWLTENKNYQVFSDPFDNGGIEALTVYRTVQTNSEYSLISFEQKTRNRNQIRAQLQQLGFPILGDKKFGSTINPLKKMALYLSELSVRHPSTGKLMEFKIPIPKDAERFMKQEYNTTTKKNQDD